MITSKRGDVNFDFYFYVHARLYDRIGQHWTVGFCLHSNYGTVTVEQIALAARNVITKFDALNDMVIDLLTWEMITHIPTVCKSAPGPTPAWDGAVFNFRDFTGWETGDTGQLVRRLYIPAFKPSKLTGQAVNADDSDVAAFNALLHGPYSATDIFYSVDDVTVQNTFERGERRLRRLSAHNKTR